MDMWQIDINKVQGSQYHNQAPQLFWQCPTGCKKQFQLLSSHLVGDLAQKLPARGLATADI